MSPCEYAEDKIKYATEDVVQGTGATVSSGAKKAVSKGNEAFKHSREVKKAEHTAKNTADDTTKGARQAASKTRQAAKQARNQTIKTSRSSAKAVKQTAKSTGKATTKTAKGTIKNTQKNVNIAQQTYTATNKTTH